MYGLFIAADDEVIRESLKTRFDWPGMGYEVRGLFEDGSDVIACIQALIERGAPLPSVLLTDVVMYDKTGLDAAEYILRNRLPIAVVLLSGYQEFEFAVRGIQCRIYDYLLKPVDPSQLRALFERLAADLDGGVLFPPAEIPAAEPLSDEAEKIRRIRRFLSDNPWPATMLVMYPIRDSIERGVVAVEINLRALGRLLDMRAYKAFDKPFIICYERESGRLVHSYEYYYQHHPEEAEPFRQIALEGGADTGLYDVNGARMVISRQPSADDSLIYCCVAPLNAYSHIMPGTLPFCLSMLAMSLLLDALMALILANWIYQPISGIVRTVRAYPHAIPDDHQKSELDEIRDHIIQMQNENDLQREKVDEYIELLQNAQMNALQSQINPHFLYNTLESIADRMIMLANGENICSDMLLLLARLGGIEYAHTHGAMTTLRAYQRMAHVTGDMSWNEKPELFRRRIAEKHYESVAGDIPEGFPMSPRNESCSTADWMQLNLWAGLLLSGEAADSAYAKAEHIFWNALAYNQIVTGGFGHRQFLRRGYGTMEFQEAWWCCTENALLAMSEYARHCVTADDEEIRVNMLVPGVYDVDGASVQIASLWPGRSARLRPRSQGPPRVRSPSRGRRRLA